jgi:hypothetical protein
MPAQRKPEGTRVRRNIHTFDPLPLNGYDGPIPDWPLHEATAPELERWERLWRSAQAQKWVQMHIETVIARYVRLSLAVEYDTRNNAGTAAMITAVTALEDRLGLSPKSLQNLNWKIEEPEQAAPVANIGRPRRLKAIDPEAG